MMLQPVAEALVLMDRVLFLKEQGIHTKLSQVFNDRISPRCYVTIADKISPKS